MAARSLSRHFYVLSSWSTELAAVNTSVVKCLATAAVKRDHKSIDSDRTRTLCSHLTLLIQTAELTMQIMFVTVACRTHPGTPFSFSFLNVMQIFHLRSGEQFVAHVHSEYGHIYLHLH